MTKTEFIEKYGKGIEGYDIELDYSETGSVFFIVMRPNYPGSRYDGSRILRWNPSYKRTVEEFLQRNKLNPSIVEFGKSLCNRYVVFSDEGDEVTVRVG